MTAHTPEQIAKWAERQHDKKPNGAAAHLSPEQKHQIRTAYLATGGNVTYTEMGARCATIIGRTVNRDTISACLKGPEYDALRKHFDTEIKASAIERLKAGIVPAADAWVRSVEVAADKGDHKPAKDLLMHTGVIEPLDDDGRAKGPLVLVLASVGDRQVYRSGGQTYEIDDKGAAIGAPKSDVTVFLGVPLSAVETGGALHPATPPANSNPAEIPMYRVAGTDAVVTADEGRDLAYKERRDVATIGLALPGLPA